MMNHNFDPPLDGYTGSQNPGAKINEDKAHNICTLLTTTSLSFEQIARKLKTTRHIVRQISRGATWTHVSRYFGLPKKKNSP